MYAHPQYQDVIPNGGMVFHDGALIGAVGHTQGSASLGLNAFGRDFQKEGLKWTKALCEKDSDGDGLTNGEELGDPLCTFEPETDVDSFDMDFNPTKASHPGIPNRGRQRRRRRKKRRRKRDRTLQNHVDMRKDEDFL